MSHTCFRRTSRGSKLAPWYCTVIHTFGYVVLGLHFIILTQFRWQTCFTPPTKWGFGLHYKVIYNNIIHLASFFSFASFLSSSRRYLTHTTDVVCCIHPSCLTRRRYSYPLDLNSKNKRFQNLYKVYSLSPLMMSNYSFLNILSCLLITL